MAAVAVSSAKRSLRAELKQRLRAMSAEERLRQSHLLAQKVMAHSRYQKSKRISIFLSMQDEVETEEIIKDIFRRGKTCFIPRYQFQSNHMDMVKLASPEEVSSLPKTSWNIHQPEEDEVREEALSTALLEESKLPSSPTFFISTRSPAFSGLNESLELIKHLGLPRRPAETVLRPGDLVS
ncbi:5-formyltetrahydrofolate cyclo-ligase isoform X2 [Callorhinus ursinus]|uniref:5-formyltetrahydrofolate cyclo-ligase isoform X2 n=1 Tax=Callorhinus ursinus TaxID=34884 RepID=UPI003CD02A94